MTKVILISATVYNQFWEKILRLQILCTGIKISDFLTIDIGCAYVETMYIILQRLWTVPKGGLRWVRFISYRLWLHIIQDEMWFSLENLLSFMNCSFWVMIDFPYRLSVKYWGSLDKVIVGLWSAFRTLWKSWMALQIQLDGWPCSWLSVLL